MGSGEVLVSVIMTTYNHQDYIEKAINSVLMQKFDLGMELIISNDCSTDNTDLVIRSIIDKYYGPHHIIYNNHKVNLGYGKNLSSTFRACRGKYIAVCEGDDYWIDDLKLQKQVDVFKLNHNCGLVHTPVKLLDNNTKEIIGESCKTLSNQAEIIPELLKSKYIEFCSTMFDAKRLFDTLDILKADFEDKTMLMGDTRIVLEIAQTSEVCFVNEFTAVYRIVSGSISHTNNVRKFLAAVGDTYKLRQDFVLRHNLNKKLLGIPVCHYNRGLIFKMYSLKKIRNVWIVAGALKIRELFKYCDLKTFLSKMNWRIFVLLFVSLTGLASLKNLIKN